VGEAQSLVYIYVYLSQATLVYCDNVSAIVFKASLRRRLSNAYASERARSSRHLGRLRFGSKARGGGEVAALSSPDGLDACSAADLSATEAATPSLIGLSRRGYGSGFN
jgi:hypothetical protein